MIVMQKKTVRRFGLFLVTVINGDAMKIKDMSNEQLVDAYAIGCAKEATWTPGPNGRGRKTFEKITARNEALKKELLRRLNQK